MVDERKNITWARLKTLAKSNNVTLSIKYRDTQARMNAEIERINKNVEDNKQTLKIELEKARNEAVVRSLELFEQRKTAKLKRDRLTRMKRMARLKQKKQEIENSRFGTLFNQLLELKRFQQILNMIINNGSILTGEQADRLYERITRTGRYMLRVETGSRIQHLPVNPVTRVWLKGFSMSGNSPIKELDNFGSDLLTELSSENINSVEIAKLTPRKKVDNKDGAFFGYYNHSPIDLSRYQIWTESSEVDNEHCLIYTLSLAGVEKSILNSLKLAYVDGANIRKSDLKAISKIIKHDLVVWSINKGKRTSVKIKHIGNVGTIDIGQHSNHYFTYEKTEYSKFSVEHLDDVKDLEDYHRIYKVSVVKGKKYYKFSDERKVDSLTLIDTLFKAGYFKRGDMSKFDSSVGDKGVSDAIYLDNIDAEQRLFIKAVGEDLKTVEENLDKALEKKTEVFYADCESYVNGVNHKLQLVGIVGQNTDYVHIFNVNDELYYGDDDDDNAVCSEQAVVYDFLKVATNNGKNNSLIYFHNLKYDYMGLLEPYLNVRSRCEKDNQIYNVIGTYKGCTVELRDSYKLLPFALSKFGSEFKLANGLCKKEALAYDYYTPENDGVRISTAEYLEFLSVEQQEIFKVAVLDCPSYNAKNQTFNPMTWYKQYLKLDCLVLKAGMVKFNTMVSDITGGMDIYDSLTISSLTDKYMTKEGAYDDVYEISGNLRAYVALSVYGGRVACNETRDINGEYLYKKKELHGQISDYDGCSLYPSAINRLCREKGLPRGVASRFSEDELNQWEGKHYSILTVRITKVNKIQQMPFIAYKNLKVGSIDYLNTPPPEPVVIDSITLRDYINFHEIEYELLDGVYWDAGGNRKMGEVIQRLYNSRLEYKKPNPALANVIKLMLNSAYGKTIMKKTKTAKVIVSSSRRTFDKVTKQWTDQEHTQFESYVYNNFNTIKAYRQINALNYEVEYLKADHSFNRGQVGSSILSTSKRIMNEVFDVANTNNLPIYYSDTDSIHIDLKNVEPLETAYRTKFMKELNGKQLEQFHTDFNLEGAVGEIYAHTSIFLGKKSYLDCLESVGVDGETVRGYHIRMKGITEDGLIDTGKRFKSDEDPMGYLGLFRHLIARDENGKPNEVEIVLNPFCEETNKKKVMFEFFKGGVKTRGKFTRMVKF